MKRGVAGDSIDGAATADMGGRRSKAAVTKRAK